MQDPGSRGTSYTGGFFILVGFAIFGQILAGVICYPVWTYMTGRPVNEMIAGMLDPANSNFVKVVQCIQNVIGFLLPTIGAAFLLNKKPLKLIGYTGKIKLWQIGLVVGITITAILSSGIFEYINEHIPISHALRTRFEGMENDYANQIGAIIRLQNVSDYLLALFVIAFIPAFCEETLFRGGLQNFLTRATNRPWLSIVVVGALFSLLHISYFGFLSRWMLGIVLGFLYQYSGRIWLNILAHFINNAITLTAIYIATLKGHSMHEAMSNDSPSLWSAAFLPILIMLMVIFKKISDAKQPASLEYEMKTSNPSNGV